MKRDERINKNQLEKRNNIAEIKNILKVFNRLEEAEERISEIEDNIHNNTFKEQQIKKIKRRMRIKGSFGTTLNVKTFTL